MSPTIQAKTFPVAHIAATAIRLMACVCKGAIQMDDADRTARDFLNAASGFAESGRAALFNLDPQSPHAEMMLRRAWDHLRTAAENVRYAAIEFGLRDPGH